MNDTFEMNEMGIQQSIESLKQYNEKIRIDMESLKHILEGIATNWLSRGEDIQSITNEVKAQILKLQNMESSVIQLIDALSLLHE